MSPARVFATVLLVAISLSELAAQSGESADVAPGAPVEKLSEFVVLAGRMPTGNAPGAILNSVEVATTPGATSDINRSLQTFPGVQLADEGNALFVRGGDSSETVTLINGIRYPGATRLSAPTGSFSGSLDPFQAKTITFLNGGFGAEHGNALSGVVDVSTRGAPSSTRMKTNTGLGAAGVSGDFRIGPGIGVRASATLSSTAPIIALNGSERDYVDKPHGHDVSVGGSWLYDADGEIKAYALDQTNRYGLHVNEAGFRGIYRGEVHSQLATLGWKRQSGAWTAAVNAGAASLFRKETIPSGRIETETVQQQMNFMVGYDATDRLHLSAGADFTNEDYDLAKAVPDGDGGEWLRSCGFSETRTGLFVQADAVVMRHVRAVAGARTDHSRLTGERTYDPRLSLAWEPRKDLSFSVAGGSAHQVPDAYYFIADDGTRLSRPAMRSRDVTFAVEMRRGLRLLRAEAYEKRYDSLAQLDRDYQPVAGGTGRARGADFFFKTQLPGLFSGRLTYSFVNADRTDPSTGRMASAPWDVTQSVSAILERDIGGWHASAAWRYATGRPFTPVTGGILQAGGDWAPVYGEPRSERLPALQRVDFMMHRTWLFEGGRGMTVYVSINNLLDRKNVYSYAYSDDYSRRRVVPSLFNRVLYFGVMLYFD